MELQSGWVGRYINIICRILFINVLNGVHSLNKRGAIVAISFKLYSPTLHNRKHDMGYFGHHTSTLNMQMDIVHLDRTNETQNGNIIQLGRVNYMIPNLFPKNVGISDWKYWNTLANMYAYS